MNPSLSSTALLFFTASSLCAGLSLATSAQSEASKPLVLFCSLDQPVVLPGGSVKATVLADSVASAPIDYRWSAQDGAFLTAGGETSNKASGSSVEWTPKGGSAGRHSISLNASDSNGLTGNCSLTVVVSSLERGSEQSSIADLARAFLPQNSLEVPGYGLYSYLILPDKCASSQSGDVWERCKIFVREALFIAVQEKDLKRAEPSEIARLNLTYLLVTHSIPSDLTKDLDENLDKQLKWILKNYDYVRCHTLLRLLRHKISFTRAGPMVVSTKEPLFRSHPHEGDPQGPPIPHLFQDLSDAPLSVMPQWLTYFANQSFQTKFWEPNGLDSLRWGLQKYLAIAALGLPDVMKSVRVFGADKER